MVLNDKSSNNKSVNKASISSKSNDIGINNENTSNISYNNSKTNNSFSINKITIEEFRDLFIQNLKGTFFKNDVIRKIYLIEGTVCSDVDRQKHGTSFKIQSDEGSVLKVYIPKRAGYQSTLEPGNKISLCGMFNIFGNNIEDEFNFIEFKASRILDSDVSESKKESILFTLNENGFLDKPKKTINFENLDFFKLMIISSKDSSGSAEVQNCLKSTEFFDISIHYIDTYSPQDVADTIHTLNKNSYYDAIMITGIENSAKKLFDEIPVLESIAECSTPIILAIGRSVSEEVVDIVEEGPLSAARMLLYEYKEYKFQGNPDENPSPEHNSNLFINLNKEQEDLKRKISSMFNENVSLLSTIRKQKILIYTLAVFSLIALAISIIK